MKNTEQHHLLKVDLLTPARNSWAPNSFVRLLSMVALLIVLCSFASISKATDLSIDGQVGYSIVDGLITVNIDKVSNNSQGGNSGSLRVKLWASNSPYNGNGACCSGFILTEFSIDNGNTLRGGFFYNEIRAQRTVNQVPQGSYYVVMTLLEYVDDSTGYVIRDYRTFDERLTFGAGASSIELSIDGNVGYQISEGQITVNINKISNNSFSGNSGTLRIKLWATNNSFNGTDDSCCNGFLLADFRLNNGIGLDSSFSYRDITEIQAFVSPPDGAYRVVMTLLEYVDDTTGFVIRDYVNFDDSLEIGGSSTINDDHGNDFINATPLPSNTSLVGNIEIGADIDVFRIYYTSAGSLSLYSTGSTDVHAVFYNSSFQEIESDDDSGEGGNFRIDNILVESGATYYLAVRGYSDAIIGAYTVRQEFTVSSPAACNDGIDNDSDGLVDLNDPGCVNSIDNDEFNTVSINVTNNNSLNEDQSERSSGGSMNINFLVYVALLYLMRIKT